MPYSCQPSLMQIIEQQLLSLMQLQFTNINKDIRGVKRDKTQSVLHHAIQAIMNERVALMQLQPAARRIRILAMLLAS